MSAITTEPIELTRLAAERGLVEKIQRGEAEAFRRLYDLYARLVYRYVLLRVRNAQDAEDVTAETFTRAWRAISAYEWRDASFGAWLLRIAHNLIVDRVRSHRDVLSWLPWQHGVDDPQLAQVEHQDEIFSAFATLSNEQQVILYLHFFEGYSLSEVAEFLGKSPNAVTVAQFRALHRLRKVLA
jgi:RNA polymerase sigma-70 factor (ECF subfamily)